MPEIPEQPVIKLRDVTFAYERRPVLQDVSLDIMPRDFLGIIGPNGSGKTTLLKIILGLLTPDSGTVEIEGHRKAGAAGLIGYVPQFAWFDRDFPISVMETVLMGLLSRTGMIGPYGKEAKEKARRTLQLVNADNLVDRQIGEISGGELQRALVARALVHEPRVLLLDEPTANIDYQAEESFFDLLHRLNENITIVLVSHDIGFVTSHVNRVACLNRTLICHPTEDISGDMISNIYQTPVDLVAHHHRIPSDRQGEGGGGADSD
ncbi:MAG: metal ABC transporter ATP-binding protein [Verrucomicrobiota bacterium]